MCDQNCQALKTILNLPTVYSGELGFSPIVSGHRKHPGAKNAKFILRHGMNLHDQCGVCDDVTGRGGVVGGVGLNEYLTSVHTY